MEVSADGFIKLGVGLDCVLLQSCFPDVVIKCLKASWKWELKSDLTSSLALPHGSRTYPHNFKRFYKMTDEENI